MRNLVTIRIDPEVWRKARELGINMSRTCENALKHEIQRIIEAKRKGNYKSPSDRKAQCLYWSPGRDSNPRPAAYEAAAITGLSYRGFLSSIFVVGCR